jgi:nucleoside-diphosphate-sugar epimerase
VSDVVDFLVKQSAALARENGARFSGQAYNVGGGYASTVSLLEFCERWDIFPSFADWRPADQKVFYCDIGKAKELFDGSPLVSLEEGLAELYSLDRVIDQRTKRNFRTPLRIADRLNCAPNAMYDWLLCLAVNP